jgi:lysine 2,3-aminomutase
MDTGIGAHMTGIDDSTELARASLRSVSGMVSAGLVPEQERLPLEAVAARYSLALTPEMAALIDPADPNDPIARQFVPSLNELRQTPEEDADPIGDNVHSPVKGLVHRYEDRVLLKPLHTCPVYCRFCFRREVVGAKSAGSLTDAELADVFSYIAAHREIFEVIVSGGDPLMLSPRRVAALADAASGIDHVKVMRWHSRVPLVDPNRVTRELIDAMRRFSGAVYVAVHANHPREFTPAGRAALARLADAGIVLVSQTVLLKGVNDDAEVLAELMRTFVANRVKPYYLHQGDLAPGTAHFRTTIEEGQALLRALRGRLSGIAQPTYVVDLPGGHGKVPVGPGYLSGNRISDPDGIWHAYPSDPSNSV